MPHVNQHASAGRATGGQLFELYDTARKRTYEASISENYGAPGTGTVTYDPALLEPANAALLAFVVSRVEKNPAFPKPDAKDPYGDMLRAWTAQNGAINAPGARFVAAKPVPAPAASCADDPRSRTAKLTSGGLTYIAVFKSGVFVLDPKKKTCALVYFPPDAYQWVDQLKVTGAWIAMRNRDTQTFVYYNPKTRQLSTVQPR